MKVVNKILERQKQLSSLLENYEAKEMLKTARDNDSYCRLLLNNLFDGYDHLPVTKSAMSFFAIVMITNDLMINGRKNVLEFGSGLSTILMARLIKKNNLPCKIYSVEHDKKWFDLLNSILAKENTLSNVVTIHAPLAASGKAKDNLDWYNEEVINNKLPENILFDLVIIDGPPAHEKSKALSRYPALPFVKDKLSKTYSIYLDDASREGEKAVVKHWAEEFNFAFTFISNRLALSSDDDFIQYSCLPC